MNSVEKQGEVLAHRLKWNSAFTIKVVRNVAVNKKTSASLVDPDIYFVCHVSFSRYNLFRALQTSASFFTK
jgi:hypothetical protein